ncbi:MAG: hypothetical protein OXN17_14530 [Candidatus Poribacteria bacterium]|nr:hypothetical protein [Candidatus Poribacteria bacterium]MDE0503991.1 hypothetical protein [Candidatus Poribacteria bacterium]
MIGRRLGCLVIGAAVVFIGCDSGKIQNFEGIEIDAISRLGRIDIRIYLTNDEGHRLLWDPSILTPQIGVSAISESEFTTNAKIYSLRGGMQGIKVYDGRVFDLRWSRDPHSPYRLLRGEVPHSEIKNDKERDTIMGILTVTVQTEKQGPFTDTLNETQIYSAVSGTN